MEIINGKVFLKNDVKSITACGEFVSYHEGNGTQIIIDSTLVIRLYDLLKYDYERNVPLGDWNQYCEQLFKKGN